MNGLEAVNKLKNESYCNCSLSDDNKLFCMGGLLKDSDELKAIECELKVLQILKDKKVDLRWIMNRWAMFYLAIEDGSSWISPLLFDYNERFGTANAHLHLTLEEMQLIVEWLRGEE